MAAAPIVNICLHGPARRADRRAEGRRVRALRAQSREPRAHPRRRIGAAHHGRVLAAQGPRAASARAHVARQADGSRARARARELRPLDRRAGVEAAQAPRRGPAAAALHPDGLGLRLRVHSRRRPAESMKVFPGTLLWRTLIVLVAALVLSQAAALWLLHEYVTQPRVAFGIGQFVSHLKTINAALATMAPEQQQAFIGRIAEQEGIRIL